MLYTIKIKLHFPSYPRVKNEKKYNELKQCVMFILNAQRHHNAKLISWYIISEKKSKHPKLPIKNYDTIVKCARHNMKQNNILVSYIYIHILMAFLMLW